jgi:multiple sugar transport system ATP-binding protein
MAGLRLHSLYKSYGNVEVIKGVDLEIEDGEFVVFVGPSGCGKSTLLRMIAGLEDITGGELYIGDRLVNDVEPRDRSIAMVFQSYALYPHMSVYDNVGFGLKLAKTPKAVRDKKIREAARILKMEHLLDRRPGQPLVAPSCANPKFSSSTSRSRTSTPPSGSTRAWRSPSSMPTSARP